MPYLYYRACDAYLFDNLLNDVEYSAELICVREQRRGDGTSTTIRLVGMFCCRLGSRVQFAGRLFYVCSSTMQSQRAEPPGQRRATAAVVKYNGRHKRWRPFIGGWCTNPVSVGLCACKIEHLQNVFFYFTKKIIQKVSNI